MSTSEIYKSETHRVRTPNGTMYGFIRENPDGTINGFEFIIGKAGNDISPWAQVVGELATLAINNGTTLEQLINMFSGLTSGREARTMNSVCRSGPEGIWMILMRYKHSKFKALQEALGVGHDDDHKGPSVAPWAKVRR